MKTYDLRTLNFGIAFLPRVPEPLRNACKRQLWINWRAFTQGDPVSYEIENAINLTRILDGEQHGDPDTRSYHPPKYKHKQAIDLPDFGASSEDARVIDDDLPPDGPSDVVIW